MSRTFDLELPSSGFQLRPWMLLAGLGLGLAGISAIAFSPDDDDAPKLSPEHQEVVDDLQEELDNVRYGDHPALDW